jgi:hypothetical protein
MQKKVIPEEMKENGSCLSPIFFPEDSNKNKLNWQVFWLTFFLKPSHLSIDKQWQRLQKAFYRLTAAGTAPVLHRIPS